MKKGNKMITKIDVNHQNSESIHNQEVLKMVEGFSKRELLEFIQELNVQKLKLEKKNDELILDNSAMHRVVKKYAEWYDLLPTGHVVLSKDGLVLDLNLSASDMLGAEKLYIVNKALSSFIVEDSKPIFNHFLTRIFDHKQNITGVVVLPLNIAHPRSIKLSGILNPNREEVLITMEYNSEVEPGDFAKWENMEKAESISEPPLPNLITDFVLARERELSLLSAAIDGFCITDLSGKIIEVNDSYCRLSGYTRDELLCMRISDLEFTESTTDTFSHLQHILENGEDRFETRHRCKDGRILDVEVSVTYHAVDGGQLIAFIHDITEHKLTEKTLRERERKFRNYIDFAPHGVFVANEFGAYVDANSAAAKITGYTREELLSMNLQQLVPEDSLKIAADHFSNVVNEGFAAAEFAFIRKDGTRGYWSVDAVKLSNHSFLGFVVDTSERKRAEEALWQSEHLLKTIMELLPIGVWVLNEKGEITMGNVAAQKIWAGIKYIGIDDFGEYKGWWLKTGKLIEPEEWSGTRAIKKGEASIEEEIKIECFDGTNKIIYNSTVPLFNNEGKVSGAIVTNQDISERKKSEEILIENEHLFRVSQAAARIGSYIIDLVSGSARVSSGIYDIFGFDENNTDTSQVWDLLIQLDSNVDFFDRIKQMEINNKISFDHEYKIVRNNDGIECWVHRLGELEFDDKQRPIKLIGTIQDITARKQAEEVIFKLNQELEVRVNERTSELLKANAYLQQAEEKYRTVADYTYGWEFWTDPNGNFFYCSPSCERITGYPPSDFLQNPQLLYDIIYPADLNYYKCHKQKEEKGKDGNLEVNYRIVRADGAIRWIGHVCQSIYNERGELIGNRGSNRDITERKNMEQLVKTSNQKYKLLSENVSDGIFICRDDSFEYVNKAMSNIFGYDENELIGLKLAQLVMPDYLDELDVIHSIKTPINQARNIELECIKKDLSVVFVEFLLNYVANERVIYGVVHDITEKKQIQKNIVKAIILTEEKERAYFSKELHDGLGPLLSTIKLYLQWSERANTSQRREEIIRQAEDIIEDALATVKEISNKLSPHLLTNHGLSSAIQSFVGKVEQSSGLRIDFVSDVKRRLGDEIEAAIYRAVIECINNTIKHAEASTISIMLSDADSQLHLHYRDDGKGFDLDETLSVKKGLGLFNLQNRVHTIGGKISMFSKPGVGVDYQIAINL
ncbi:MAG: PAS domain S-box protein [Prolixibacteraceae bacterium]|nr:PAS domain S-box protein [Prolixibacteraceae bacterium]